MEEFQSRSTQCSTATSIYNSKPTKPLRQHQNLTQKSIKLLTCINLFTSSILCFVYLIVIIIIITFFLPLCGSIFGTAADQLISYAKPETDNIDFLLFQIELPKISLPGENSGRMINKNKYVGDQNQLSYNYNNLQNVLLREKVCDPSSKKIIAHLNSIDNEVLLKMILIFLGFVFLFVTTIITVCLSCRGLLSNGDGPKNSGLLSQKNSCWYTFIILCLPIIEIITIFCTSKIYELISKSSLLILHSLNNKIFHDWLKNEYFSRIDALRRVSIAAIMFVLYAINILQIMILVVTSILTLLIRCQKIKNHREKVETYLIVKSDPKIRSQKSTQTGPEKQRLIQSPGNTRKRIIVKSDQDVIYQRDKALEDSKRQVRTLTNTQNYQVPIQKTFTFINNLDESTSDLENVSLPDLSNFTSRSVDGEGSGMRRFVVAVKSNRANEQKSQISLADII